jgi:hypothetical protein
MKRNIFFCFVLISILACDKNNADCKPQRITNCNHTLEFNPVCGCDGATYINSGEAACNSILHYTEGPCALKMEHIIGRWNFLGFKNEGAEVSVNTKVHPYNIYLELKTNGSLIGAAPINSFRGSFGVFKDSLRLMDIGITEIGGSEVDQNYERAYMECLTVKPVKVVLVDDFMALKSLCFDNAASTYKEKTLIFKKN